MKTLRTSVKALLGSAYFHSMPGQRRLRQAGVVLMLHRVLPTDQEAALPHRQSLCIGQPSFEHLLVWLQRHFDCVPLEQLLQSPAGGRPQLALTFDDGWRDNAELVYPLLARYEVPASIFLSTDFIGTQRGFWWESIGETLWQLAQHPDTKPLLEALAGVAHPVPAQLLESHFSPARSLALAAYLQSLKDLLATQLQQLADLCPVPEHPQAMTWEQVQDMERSGLIRFGPHGASHAILDQLADEELTSEVIRSRDMLAKQCTAPLPVYCYPNGNHDARVRAAVAAAGYSHALSTQSGLVQSGNELLALPRIDLSHAAAARPALLTWRLLQGAYA